MVQTGVPFGEVAAVRDWLGIECAVRNPQSRIPWRPIEGFACLRSEVSGRRLWGLFRERFGSADAFFAEHFVANYCPLAFFDHGRNLTPDKLPAAEAAPLHAACDAHLRAIVAALQPEWVIGVGSFAEARAVAALAGTRVEDGASAAPESGESYCQPRLGRSRNQATSALGAFGSDVAAVRPRRGCRARRARAAAMGVATDRGRTVPGAACAKSAKPGNHVLLHRQRRLGFNMTSMATAAVTTSGCCPR
jgi:hypothetical protein